MYILCLIDVRTINDGLARRTINGEIAPLDIVPSHVIDRSVTHDEKKNRHYSKKEPSYPVNGGLRGFDAYCINKIISLAWPKMFL